MVGTRKIRESKYNVKNLTGLFRLAADFRERANRAGFSDNAGAIHSAERALHLLGPRLVHPGMGHLNNYRHHKEAIFSRKASTAYKRGERVMIEHVAPHRELTALAIKKIVSGASDEEFIEFVKAEFKIVLLTPEETARLNKMNRSKIDPERLEKAGIRLGPILSPKKGQSNRMDSVEIEGKRYRSVKAAWNSLRLGDTGHQAFRLKLKRSASGELDYTVRSTGRIYKFRLIPFDATL